ncbi:AraC family transcriptional regulator [Saccharibacillus sacchari]|uniref:AraC family transcriptional regulator n=1 Tax=Saccharibacillus sacchari TaxID=456493 RepID=A0ACC6P8X0_9BACL
MDPHIRLWTQAAFKLHDIRAQTLEVGSGEYGYRFPASAFLVMRKGRLELKLDGQNLNMEARQIVHAGQGAKLRMRPIEDCEYVLMLYRGELLLPFSQKLRRQLEECNPFAVQYRFIPAYPLELLELAETLLRDWQSDDALDKLHARATFASFVHELMRQMKRSEHHPVQPDLLDQTLRYLESHYRHPISLEQLADVFGCSVSFLSKLFKNRLDESPMRALTRIRMERAAYDLRYGEWSVQQLAERCGYPDAHSFSRAFKKFYGTAPMRYRAGSRQGNAVPDLPFFDPKSAVFPPSGQCYNGESVEKHYHLSHKGDLSVRKRTSAVMLTFALFGMLLSACSGTGTANTNQSANAVKEGTASQKTAAAENTADKAPQTATQVYRDSMGDVTIPAHPQRIVDLTGSAIGNLLVLGVKPVAAVDYSLSNPYHDGMLDDIEDIGDAPTAEVVLAQKPDLIIAFDYLEEADYEQLKRIAPVVRLKYGGMTPQNLLMEFGKITGKENEAQQWVEGWEAKIAEVKPKIRAVVGERTVSILQPYAKGIYAWGNKGGRGGEILYDDLELKAPDIVRETLIDGQGFGGDLSLEKLPDYAGDYIFTSNWGWDDGDASVVYDSEIWKSLEAVKNDRVFWIDPKGSYYNDPISLEAQLKLIEESFLGSGSSSDS